jgi:glycosyltransferase involved in cell wall biosynthesis
VGRLAAILAGVPVIIHTFHGHVFHSYFGWAKTQFFLWLERAAARFSTVILTVSERLREELIVYRIAPPERIRVIPLGLPLARYQVLDGLRGHLRAELGYSTDEKLIGIIGRLVPIKDHDLFLTAAQQVREQIPQARFLIIGDGERRADLEASAIGAGLADVVVFTGWRSDLPTIYADLDVVVISSLNEGTPVSLIEAMSAGVPVVSTAVGGVPDVLQQGLLGSLTPSGDAEALAEGIVEAITRPSAERVAAARSWAMNQYDAARLVTNIRELYWQELARKGLAMPDKPSQASDLRDS